MFKSFVNIGSITSVLQIAGKVANLSDNNINTICYKSSLALERTYVKYTYVYG